MKEAEWDAAVHPAPMLEFLRSRTSDRKLRLFACAWYCRFPLPVGSEQKKIRWVLQVGERYADGRCDETERAAAHEWAQLAVETAVMDQTFELAASLAEVRQCCARKGSEIPWAVGASANPKACALVREIFGNPFRPVAFDPAWRTTDVLLLAQGIYEERAFDRMPILADALQDANCNSDDVLNHLRDPHAAHVRGCWALDLVLGRE